MTIGEVITAALRCFWLFSHRNQRSVLIVLVALVRISQRYIFRKVQSRGASGLLILFTDSRACVSRGNSVNKEKCARLWFYLKL